MADRRRIDHRRRAQPYIIAPGGYISRTLCAKASERGLAIDTASLIGALVDERFQIVRQIGRGGMGAVYEAEHAITKKRVAIKVMSDSLETDHEFGKRFLREAKVMSILSHSAICAVQAMGIWNGRLYLVMDFVEGRDLSEVLKSGPLPPEKIRAIMPAVFDALTEAHSKGVVHRDLKPSNIMLTAGTADGDRVKVLDFGLATVVDQAAGRLTQTGQVFGSPHYMSPEQINSSRKVDGRADIYALGCILYQMVAGHVPFSGETMLEIFSKQLTARVPKVEGATPAVQQLLENAMRKDPDNRYHSTSEFKADFQNAFAGRPVAAKPADVLPGDPVARKRRLIQVTTSGTILAAVSLVVAIFCMQKIPPIPAHKLTGDTVSIPKEINSQSTPEEKRLFWLHQVELLPLKFDEGVSNQRYAEAVRLQNLGAVERDDERQRVLYVEALNKCQEAANQISTDPAPSNRKVNAMVFDRMAQLNAQLSGVAPAKRRRRFIADMLSAHEAASAVYEQLTPGYRKDYRYEHRLGKYHRLIYHHNRHTDDPERKNDALVHLNLAQKHYELALQRLLAKQASGKLSYQENKDLEDTGDGLHYVRSKKRRMAAEAATAPEPEDQPAAR